MKRFDINLRFNEVIEAENVEEAKVKFWELAGERCVDENLDISEVTDLPPVPTESEMFHHTFGDEQKCADSNCMCHAVN